MGECSLEGCQGGSPFGVDCGDGGEENLAVARVNVVHEDGGVVLFFLELDRKPVGDSVVAFAGEVHRHGEIEVGRPEFGVNLGVYCVLYFVVQHNRLE